MGLKWAPKGGCAGKSANLAIPRTIRAPFSRDDFSIMEMSLWGPLLVSEHVFPRFVLRISTQQCVSLKKCEVLDFVTDDRKT